ncbi:MAG: AAA family ATPase [Polyangiales bacterium]
MEHDLQGPSAALREAIRAAGEGLVEREALVELVALAAVGGEHLLVIGPPGTAKSEAVRRATRALGGSCFEYLLGRFTEPAEIFGPIDLRRLREGVVEVETAGMLPEADLAFLDEVFLGSSAILNTLLGILNERTFRRGSTSLRCPLRVCVGASNALPEDPSLGAFADRFVLRAFVDPVSDPMLEELLAGGWSVREAPAAQASLRDLDALVAAARDVDVAPVRAPLARAIRTLRREGVALSDRRAVRTQRLVAAAAALSGRDRASEADLWPLLTAVPTRDEQAVAREALRDLLQRSESGALLAAAEQVTASPAARARRLAAAASQALRDGADLEGDERAAWSLRAESILREIDAGFAAGAAPVELSEARGALASAVARGAGVG